MATETEKIEENPAEAEILVPEPRYITLNNGERFQLPVMNWGKELRILRVVKDVMNEVVASGIFQRQLDENGDPVPIDEVTATQKVMSLVFGTGPEKLTEAASAITGQKPEWVLENLTIEPILQMVVDFLRAKQDSIRKFVEPYLPAPLVPSAETNPTLN